jgi:hypothetical protein
MYHNSVNSNPVPDEEWSVSRLNASNKVILSSFLKMQVSCFNLLMDLIILVGCQFIFTTCLPKINLNVIRPSTVPLGVNRRVIDILKYPLWSTLSLEPTIFLSTLASNTFDLYSLLKV